jgi:septal ring-binding cell division protein DamX
VGAAAASPKVTGSLEEPIVNEIPVRKAAQVLLAQNQKLRREVENITVKEDAPTQKQSAPVAKALSQALLRQTKLQDADETTLDVYEDVQPQALQPLSVLDGWDDNDYVWQIMVAHDVKSLSQLKGDLGEKLIQLKTKKAGKSVYIALMGAYKSQAEAKAAWAQVPASTKMLKPWLRAAKQLKKLEGRQ